jgi:hypothetical protein
MREGIYFLANDRVIEWAIGFFESLRVHEPALPLVMIPFDDRTDRLRALADRYRYTIFEPPWLAELDEIGKRFHPPEETVPRHTYRKFAVFDGPLERFIFSDVDIVLLDSLREHFDAYDRAGKDLLHADEEIDQVYHSPLCEHMVASYGARGFNTGFWAARRGLFTLEEVRRLADEALPHAEGFNHGTYEQPFLNFCCDVKGVRYANFADVVPDLTRKHLSNQPGIARDADGKWRIHDPASGENGKRIGFVHWAGQQANELMAYRSLYLSYRLRSEPPLKRTWIKAKRLPRAAWWNLVRWGRATQWISRTYKRLIPMSLQLRFARVLYRK